MRERGGGVVAVLGSVAAFLRRGKKKGLGTQRKNEKI